MIKLLSGTQKDWIIEKEIVIAQFIARKGRELKFATTNSILHNFH